MKFATFDLSEAPLLKLDFSSETPTDEQFEMYLEEYKEIIMSHSEYWLTISADEVKYLSAKHRIQQGKWQKENAEEIRKRCRGIAFVLNSVILKMLFRAILVVSDIPAPYKVVSSQEEGIDYLREQGLNIP